jgi:hypothetical protein
MQNILALEARSRMLPTMKADALRHPAKVGTLLVRGGYNQ